MTQGDGGTGHPDWCIEYELPEELIATHPVEPRDQARLMVVPQELDAPPHHARFCELGRWMRAGDVLVVNDSKVIPARIEARRATGGSVEILLLEMEGTDGAVWSALVRPAARLHPREMLELRGNARAEMLERDGEAWRIRLHVDGPPMQALHVLGSMPLPPYILKARARESGTPGAGPAALTSPKDATDYQTVYARTEGSVAAPTAGLHFTERLMAELESQGVEVVRVTLHVGAGTFKPLTREAVERGSLHWERYEVTPEAAARINRARAERRRVIAVGTTSIRTLESLADEGGTVRSGAGKTDLLIAPGFRFRVVDAAITNFHLPGSSLLLLVAALMGRQTMLDCYRLAIRERYRFYSYGDAMFIPRRPSP